jgi:hypothetical protein
LERDHIRDYRSSKAGHPIRPAERGRYLKEDRRWFALRALRIKTWG